MLIARAQALSAPEIAVILPTDIPTRAHIDHKLVSRVPWSLDLRAHQSGFRRAAERTEFHNLAAQAVGRLRDAWARRPEAAVIDEKLAQLGEEEEFWLYHVRSLSAFATP